MASQTTEVEATMTLPGKQYNVKMEIKVVPLPASPGSAGDEACLPVRVAGGDRVPQGGVYSIKFSFDGRGPSQPYGWWVRENGELELG
jgi:hypothetical protein